MVAAFMRRSTLIARDQLTCFIIIMVALNIRRSHQSVERASCWLSQWLIAIMKGIAEKKVKCVRFLFTQGLSLTSFNQNFDSSNPFQKSKIIKLVFLSFKITILDLANSNASLWLLSFPKFFIYYYQPWWKLRSAQVMRRVGMTCNKIGGNLVHHSHYITLFQIYNVEI